MRGSIMLFVLPSSSFRTAGIIYLIIIVVSFIIITALIVSAQIFLSKMQKRCLGLIPPIIFVFISFIICLQVPFYYEVPYPLEFYEEGHHEEYYEKYDRMRISSKPTGTFPVYMPVNPSPIKYLDDDGDIIIIGETIVEKIPGAIFNTLGIFGLCNICTVILLVIHFVCRKKITAN